MMTPEQRVVSLAADEADERTAANPINKPGVWHQHFLDSLSEQGWEIKRR